ncbi:BTAD domain-containing putative transcriptional regulator [Actinoplanes sp. NPDC024001]|uniref:AfsR/SARP family transcriptional regulator n=1 Tax=Actinoplanes sp. NPDC024001 TaxID=3154598 RepID=UPI0033C82663
MRFGILGPLELWQGDDPVPVGGPQQRALLAALLVDAGRVVSTDRLIECLWGESPPPTARALLQGSVAELRRTLRRTGRQCLASRPPGYLLELLPGELDADRFEELTAASARAATPTEAADLLYRALALWRGPTLDGIAVDGLAPAVARWEERRLEVVEQRIDLDLRLGRDGLVGELRGRVAEHPLRERLWAQLMLALHRAGRQADALAAYAELRTVLVEQLGVEPGPAVQELHRTILAGEVTPAPPERAMPAPAQLPAAVSAFTGRADLLQRLDELAGDTGAMAVAAVTGTAGVGKTALAVHWAHRARDRFPDGQLYVDLRGFAAAPPVRPIEALTGFLTALGVPAEQVPVEQDSAAALFRSTLAGRRVLVVLDDAAGVEQVRPLLPGTPGCLVLVTSRHRLGGLVARDGARRFALDVLTEDEAGVLLHRLVGAERVAAEADAAARLCRLCAYLPLALRIATAELTGGLADQVARLTGDRLDALSVEDDPDSAVRAAFDASYTALDPAERRLFRLLGLVPAVHATPAAAAALAGLPQPEATALLNRLAAAHLLDRPAAGRYTWHDLLRTYAAERAGAEEETAAREAAVARWRDRYVADTLAAARTLNPEMLRLPSPHVTDPGDHQAALAWLDAERPNLIAAVRHAAQRGAAAAWLIADALRGYFWLRMYTLDWLDVAAAGLAAATAAGDLAGQAAARLSLGDVHGRQGRYDEAIAHYRQALELNRACGWTDGESASLGNLGNVYWWAGRLPEAADHYAQALALAQATGRVAGQAVNLGNLGAVYWDLGDLERSAEHHRRALELDRALQSPLGEAVDLGNLGRVRLEQGRVGEALTNLERALVLHREIGDRSGEAETLRMLAEAHRATGRGRHAAELAERAVRLAHDSGNLRYEADALNTAGTCVAALGRTADAVTRHEQALALAQQSGSRYPEIVALTGLAAVQEAPDRALSFALRAVALARQSGFHLLEGHALRALAAAHRRSGDAESAAVAGKEARAVLSAAGSAAADADAA